ncbi:hypothetical protein C8F04DRAFT_1260580 [Mycena alexandri]|uniref:Uncharacterized protein n=1 Tax=Mycena alexandri TaxID=1745969 RepID=A0AAD6X255_9AGAR|nr:hypothetical protein C8F04DRAFT_1260580 [Mycena alexandri]
MARSSDRSRTAPAFSTVPQPALRLNMPRVEALRYIRGRPTPEEQIQYHVANAGLYAGDGRYDLARPVPARALSKVWGDNEPPPPPPPVPPLRAHGPRPPLAFRLQNPQPLPPCAFPEHLSHLGFKCDAPADRSACPSCGTTHCEYWRLMDVGCSFRALVGRFRAFVNAIGESGVRMRLLTDYRVAFPERSP